MNIFTTIKQTVALTDIVSQYTTLKQAGIYWKGRCPFHQEKTASFTITPHLHIFYCFGCHESGDVISFVAKIENCTQIEAAQQLAQKYNISLEGEGYHKTKSNTDQYQHICNVFTSWCVDQLAKHQQPYQYLTNRGFTKDTIQLFNVGYLPGGFTPIKQFMTYFQKNGFLMADLVEAGLMIQAKKHAYSPFEERIIFPIKNHLGLFCGFGGRIFKPHDERVKYYNSKEHEFFSKGNIVFGLELARSPIQQADNVFLVEGYTDCMAMVQLGYKNTVATLGTACTSNHLKLLSRYTNKATIIYDGDQAGTKGITKIAQLCWDANIEPSVVQLAKDKDPAAMLNDAAILQTTIAQAEDIFIFCIRSIVQDYKNLSLQDKLNHVHTIVQLLQSVDDQLKQNILIQHASEQLQIPFETLSEEIKKKPASENKPNQQVSLSHSYPEQDQLSISLLAVISQNPALTEHTLLQALIDYIASPINTIITELIKWREASTENSQKPFQAFIETLPTDTQRYIFQLVSKANLASINDFDNILRSFQRRWWKDIVVQCKGKIKKAERLGETARVKTLIEQFTLLQKNMLP